MKFVLAAETKAGKRKPVNQDSIYLCDRKFGDQESVLAIVCDGMGGLEDGELASKSMVRSFDKWFIDNGKKSFERYGKDDFEEWLYESWEKMIQNTHETIKEYGQRKGIRIGTTVTAMLFRGDRFYIAHVGDCRVYEIKKNVVQLTCDQTLERFVDPFTCEEKNSIRKRMASVLLQGVGASEKIFPIYISGELEINNAYLLCSDGLRHKITREEMQDFFCPNELKNQEKMKKRIDKAINTAIIRGERDDISALLIMKKN